MTQADPIIRLRGLEKSYDGKTKALQGIDIDIEPGQIIGYIGPNGAGKTTTVRILTGQIPDYEGEVRVFGLDMARDSLAIKKRIGYVPEELALYDSLTPREFLEFIGSIYGLSTERVQAKSEKLLELFGLKDQIDGRMTSFSKGMKQKVLIISGLIHDPDLIFLDEPLSGLDANSTIVIKEILSRLAAEGKTIFYCSHLMDIVEKLSHRIILIDKGRVIADAPFQELKAKSSDASLERIFTQLTGNSEHERIAAEIIGAMDEERP